jgi:single-strand DNA-binding protein
VECAYWTDRTGIAPYLKKGTQVYAEGSPEVRTYPKNDGTTGVSLTLRVQSVQLLGSRGEGGGGGYSGGSEGGYAAQAGPARVPSAGEINEPIDDLPF